MTMNWMREVREKSTNKVSNTVKVNKKVLKKGV
jgi:hypothetical protein